MKPLNGLRLILGILRTQAVYRCAQGDKLGVVVPIGTGLRRTTTCPGDGVPRCRPAERLLIRTSRSWVAIDDEPRSTFLGQTDHQPGRSPQGAEPLSSDGRCTYTTWSRNAKSSLRHDKIWGSGLFWLCRCCARASLLASCKSA